MTYKVFKKESRNALRHPRICLLGLRESRGGVGMTYDDDPWSPRSRAYDFGRAIGCWFLGIE